MMLEDVWNDLSHDERVYLGNDGWLYLGPADAPRSAAVWWDDKGYHIADYETVALPDDAEWWITTHDLVACQPRPSPRAGVVDCSWNMWKGNSPAANSR